jgi:cob(I)alamin adenosyltransferase|tara:strand:+ start:976 stop:1656 length:681 start_codon:yes stop_codon:yes gene_type:complete
MMVRINRVHTGGGDSGKTSLVDGSRVEKSDSRIEIVGTCDELNSWMGIIVMEANRLDETADDGGSKPTVRRVRSVVCAAIARLQHELFDLGAELACPIEKIPEYMTLVDQECSDRLISEMDAWNESLSELTSFILPAGSPLVAVTNLARTVCRRLERRMVAISEGIRPLSLQYINRLSDWLFILGRWVSLRLGEDETLWKPIGERRGDRTEMIRIQDEHDDVVEKL